LFRNPSPDPAGATLMATRAPAAFPCPSTIPSRIACATLVAGSLDLLGAFVIAGASGKGPDVVLQGIASALLGTYAFDGNSIVPYVVGLGLHFFIMAVMVTVYVTASRHYRQLNAHPFVSGILYGILLWAVMYGIVLPLRWSTLFPILDPGKIAGQLFCHIVLVGLPIAHTAARRC
jgi:hypothetical protein